MWEVVDDLSNLRHPLTFIISRKNPNLPIVIKVAYMYLSVPVSN